MNVNAHATGPHDEYEIESGIVGGEENAPRPATALTKSPHDDVPNKIEEKNHAGASEENNLESGGDAGARPKQNPGPPRWRTGVWRWTKIIFWFILGQWLVIGLGLACMFAALFPNVAARDGVIKSQYTILYGAVAIIFLISGMQITREKLVSHITSWRLHLITQVMSFLITPGFMLAIVKIIIVGGGLKNSTIDISMLVGLVALGALPTTIASNVVLTRNAGGDDAAAMIEVMIGNVLGPFITPVLITWLLPKDPEFGPWSPTATSSLGDLYRDVFKQIGLSVLIPLVVGQTLQWLWPVQVKKIVTKFYLAKLSTAGMLLLVWSTFSSCFKTGALYKISHSTVICNVFLNLGIYFFFTLLCFYMCRPLSLWKGLDAFASRFMSPKVKKILLHQVPKRETIAVCFCGAAKTTALGVPMVAAMWANADGLKVDSIQIPVVLYTTEQIFCAQLFVYVFQRWLGKDDDEADETEEDHVVGQLPS